VLKLLQWTSPPPTSIRKPHTKNYFYVVRLCVRKPLALLSSLNSDLMLSKGFIAVLLVLTRAAAEMLLLPKPSTVLPQLPEYFSLSLVDCLRLVCSLVFVL